MQAVIRIGLLPDGALDAAAQFHSVWLGRVRDALAGDVSSLVLMMPAAPYDHRDWRIAAVRDLARAFAPQRVNMIAAKFENQSEEAAASTLSYLERAPGVTGQLLQIDGRGAADPAG